MLQPVHRFLPSIAASAALGVALTGCSAGPHRDPSAAASTTTTASASGTHAASSTPVLQRSKNAPQITIADGVLAQGEPWDNGNPPEGWTGGAAFLISPGDSEAAIEAVRAAAKRFMMIDEHGHEMTQKEFERSDAYSPNYVGGYRTDAALTLYPDTKGELPRVQGETMLRVLVQELEAHGVDAHIGIPPRNLTRREDLHVLD